MPRRRDVRNLLRADVAQLVDAGGKRSPDLSRDDDVEAVRVTRGVLQAPDRYLHALLDDD